MTLWLEDDDERARSVSSRSVEIGFRIEARQLPVDHAEALSRAVLERIPWLAEDPFAAIHPVHVAASQNGWERPDRAAGGLLVPSRRTRLRVRISRENAATVSQALGGQRLDIEGHEVLVTSASLREPGPSSTLIARYTAYALDQDAGTDDEDRFVGRVVADCQRIGFTPTRLLCGKCLSLRAGGSDVTVRSVLLADVPEAASVALQDDALGDWRLQGFGIPIPHKDTRAVGR